ncbi:hypothetical protein JCM11491_002698 [Sporobolomyces phaffii]
MTYLVTLHAFVLSPVSLPTLVVRVASQVQFSAPRKSHPHRSLRYFVAFWTLENAAVLSMTLLWGSRGTKGPTGWAQRGIVVDFIGQRTTPSKVHMVALDLLIALLQFLTLVVSFAITLPSDLDASTSTSTSSGPVVPTTTTTTTGVTVTVTMAPAVAPATRPAEPAGEAARDYFGLLGLHEDDSDSDDDLRDVAGFGEFELSSEGEDDDNDIVAARHGRGKRKRTRGGGGLYEAVEGHDHRDDEHAIVDEDDDDYNDDAGVDLYYGPASTSASSSRAAAAAATTTTTKPADPGTAVVAAPRERVAFVPIAKLRFRHVWNEVRPGSFVDSFERDLRDEEEGRTRGRRRVGATTATTRPRRGDS